MIQYGQQSINQADLDAVSDVLKSKFLTQGPMVPRFEADVSMYCGAEYAVAVNSATSALHLAYLALGLKRGDIVWTSPVTFAATANAALFCGAKVDFVDIDCHTYNISIEALSQKLAKAEIEGKLPKLVVPVHLSGQPADMESVYKLSQKYGFKIVEDASHGIGASYKYDRIGKCRFSDITVFSFHPVKIITTCEGGVATTNDPLVADKMRLLRSHGITRDHNKMINVPDGDWYYEQIDLGFNYRMSDLHAALGVSQLARVDEFVERRHELANRYRKLLSDIPLKLPFQLEETYSSYHLFIIQITENEGHIGKKLVFDYLRTNEIGVNLHYIPVYKHPYYRKLGFPEKYCQNAETYYARSITLPIHPMLSDDKQAYICQTLQRVIT